MSRHDATAGPSRTERALLAEGSMMRKLLVHVALWLATALLIAAVTRANPVQSPMPHQFVPGLLKLAGLLAPPIYAARWLAGRARPGTWLKVGLVMAGCAVWSFAFAPMMRRLGTDAPLVSLFAACLFAVALTLAIRGMLAAWQTDRRLPVAKRLQSAAEQRLLGSKMAPQVLSDNLRTLHEVALRAPERTSSLILDLSVVMRHLVEAPRRDEVAFHEERRYIEACARLCLARDHEVGTISLEFEGDGDEAVPSLLAATLFHHALRRDRGSAAPLDVRVAMSATEVGIRLSISQRTAGEAAAAIARREAEIGLALLRRRLHHVMPGRHRLEAQVHGDNFRVELATW